ncbi:protein-disulfide reductase DsbD family protein [Novosphingobium sp. JCM 18896]|uniref:protein-disulfide reductase DsbD family protein n=1 Tax=Novosphingobium sp. JCM 18896 TaxID=2989731 RepID=UPI0022215BD1|nr:protein-disulfide reductase DsbD domain-containing protein [Novosphingobium sp. JCM 18896]MCW1428820.1 protein-disulfide reductase DsbD family protein [Novosphingobium sp. JCM 18896]
MRCYRLLVAVLWQVLALFATAAAAQAAPTHIQAELVAESAANPGETLWLALRMRPEPGWHGYWSNPGDAGLGMTLGWTLPAGAKAGEPRYPVPETLLISGLMNHVYEHEYAVLVPLNLAADAAPGQQLVRVEAQWLACTDKICVPEQASLETTVTIGPRGTPDARFDTWRRHLPAPLGAEAHFVREGGTIRLGIPLPASLDLAEPHLFATEDRLIAYAAPQKFSRKGDLLIVELERPKLAAKEPVRLSGVLRLNAAGDGVSFDAAPGAVPTDGTPLAAEAPATTASLPWLLLLALAGGLLLNVMPCVFPILSLKALSLARSGESAAHARREGLAYSAGVIVACALLGALLLSLRAAGEEVGWAFQLQEPGVVAALLLLAVAITANLLGLFEFAVPGFATEGSPQGAFATGLLAAFVATPCTGPFMAAAMGAALLLPVPSAMALFVALGLGLALPFLAIAYVPALRRALPKPGAWMAKFKLVMALPMALTAAALLWLSWRIGGSDFLRLAAVMAVGVLAVLTEIGRRQRAGRSALATALAGLVVTVVGGALALSMIDAKPAAETQGILPAKPFSEAALSEARSAGKPVFAYFTADWCLTCKVNEQVAIEREEVRDAFAKAGVVVLRGDWTRRDPAITRYLTAQGAAGVPLYVWYPAGKNAPRQLPQVLTADGLVALTKP